MAPPNRMSEELPLSRLYEGHPHLPYAWYRDLDPAGLAALAAERARGIAAGEGSVPHLEREGEGTALAIYRASAWDTAVLGRKAADLAVFDLSAPLLADKARARAAAARLARAALETARADGTEYLFVRVDARAVPVVMGLEDAGFRTVDGILRFGFDLSRPVPGRANPSVRIRDAGEADVEPLRALAERGFVYDRFHNDPAVPDPAADRLHGEWVANAVRGGYGAGVLAAEVEGEPAGFFILAEDALVRKATGSGVGTLVLITVDSRHRRKGIAQALSRASMERLCERGNRFAEVGTQIGNVPATNVYLASGFRLVATGLSLRWCAGEERE